MPDWRNPEFDWNPWGGGNSDKLIDRHDVYPDEAEQIFYNGPLVRRHGENAEKELRYFIYGQTDEGRYLFLVCILRGGRVRIYSARDMTDDEQHQYRVHRRSAKGRSYMIEHSRQLPPPRDIPQFHSEDEEAAYWSQHDSAAIMAETAGESEAPPADLRTGPGRQGSRAKKRPGRERMKLISLYLPEEMIDAVKSLAARDTTAYQALIRSWIGERLHQEVHKTERLQEAELQYEQADFERISGAPTQLLAALQRCGQVLTEEPGAINAALVALIDAQQHELRMQQREALLMERIYAALVIGAKSPPSELARSNPPDDGEETVAAPVASGGGIRR